MKDVLLVIALIVVVFGFLLVAILIGEATYRSGKR